MDSVSLFAVVESLVGLMSGWVKQMSELKEGVLQGVFGWLGQQNRMGCVCARPWTLTLSPSLPSVTLRHLLCHTCPTWEVARHCALGENVICI
jgi:hypothetical protein